MSKHLRIAELILWQDDDYLAINKPPFISTLDDRNDETNILALARQEIETAQVCHRLDKETSGVLLLAKNAEAYRQASIQFEKREVKKIYHAVTDGLQAFDNKRVDEPIYKLNTGTVRIDRREGKQAQTFFTTLRTYRNHTLLECRPITGRMHQIRIHLAFLEAPITGDEMYGGKMFYLSSVKRNFNLKKFTEEQPLMKRMALHAHSLELASLSGQTVRIEAPYPKDMRVLIRQLEQTS